MLKPGGVLQEDGGHARRRDRPEQDEHAGFRAAVSIHLGAGEDKDVLVAGVFMERNATPGMKPEEGGGGAGLAFGAELEDVDAFLKRLPGQLLLPAGNLEEIVEFDHPRGIIVHADYFNHE